MKSALKCLIVPAIFASVASACATTEYTASNPAAHVLPSKGWYKRGASGQDAYLTWQQCIAEAKEQPGYLDASRMSRSVPDVKRISEWTNEYRDRKFAPNAFVGNYSHKCMVHKGFRYMVYPPGEQVYVPLPSPKNGWVRPGFGYMQMVLISTEN